MILTLSFDAIGIRATEENLRNKIGRAVQGAFLINA